MSEYDGLTRNPWPGSWSPDGEHPIVLSQEIRGSLRTIRGGEDSSAYLLSDISGQRLEDGMIVYVRNGYVVSGIAGIDSTNLDSAGFDSNYTGWLVDSDLTVYGNTYYQYITDSDRNVATGSLVNAPENWRIINLEFDSDDVLGLIDSDYIKGFIDSDYIKGFIDSNYVNDFTRVLVDSDYINSRLDDSLFLDSDEVIALIDSEYVNARLDDTLFLDSAEVIALVDSDYIFARLEPHGGLRTVLGGKVFGGTDSDLYLDSETDTLSDISGKLLRDGMIVYVRNTYVVPGYGQYIGLTDSQRDSAGLPDFFDSDYRGWYIESDLTIQGDTYYQFRTDSEGEWALVNDRNNWVEIKLDFDSDEVRGMIDSDYIAARQIKYDFLDSAEVISLIDSAYINARVDVGIDSDAIIQLIDSAYIQSRQVDLFRDSAFISNIIDSAYINFRVDFDSASTRETIDVHVDSQFMRRFIDFDDSNLSINVGASEELIDAKLQVLTLDDIVLEQGLKDQIIIARGNGQVDWRYYSDIILDSAEIQRLIDSVYVKSHIDFEHVAALLDSTYIKDIVDSVYLEEVLGDTITSSIDSAYINARVDPAVDSAEVMKIIDSTYIGQYSFDSADVISFVDSEYINARVDRLDSDYWLNVIDGKIQTLTLDDLALLGVPQNNRILIAEGGGDYRWIDYDPGTDSAEVLKIIYANSIDSGRALRLIDSIYIKDIIDSTYIDPFVPDNLIDCEYALTLINQYSNNEAETITLITQYAEDSVGVRAIIDNYVDADFVQNLADTAYVTSIIDEEYIDLYTFDSVDIQEILDERLEVQVNDLIDGKIQVLQLDDIIDQQGTYDQVIVARGNGVVEWKDPIYLLDSTRLGTVIDSTYVKSFIDSAYINLRVDPAVDSAEVIKIIDSGYILTVVDSDYIQKVAFGAKIDSAYLQDITDAKLQALTLSDLTNIEEIGGNFLRAKNVNEFAWEDIRDIIDSSYVTGFIDSDYLQEYVRGINDSAYVLKIFNTDSSVINLTVNNIEETVDYDYIINILGNPPDSDGEGNPVENVGTVFGVDSDATNQLIDARLQVLSLDDIVGYVGKRGEILQSLGAGDATWSTLDGLATDTDTVLSIISNDFGGITYDSAVALDAIVLSNAETNTRTIVDSAYINLRVDFENIAGLDSVIRSISLDSQEALDLIEKNAFDSSKILNFVDSDYVRLRSRNDNIELFDARLQVVSLDDFAKNYGQPDDILTSLGAGEAEWRPITQNTSVTNFITDEITRITDFDYLSGILDTDYVRSLANQDWIRQNADELYIKGIVDSVYINALARIDSPAVINLIDSDYILYRLTEETVSALVNPNLVGSALDSAAILQFVIPAIQANSLDSPEAIQLIREYSFDSAQTETFVNNLIESSYGPFLNAQDQQDIVDAAVQVLDITDLAGIGSDGYPGQFLVSLGNGDATWQNFEQFVTNIGVIDSDQVVNIINTDPRITRGVDTAEAILLINEYSVDTGEVYNIIDSAYVAPRAKDAIEAAIQVLDFGDLVSDVGQGGQFLVTDGAGGIYYVNGVGADSDLVEQQVLKYLDSAAPFRDSAEVISLINIRVPAIVDSAYINFRVDEGIDSSLVINLIDSAYINDRVSGLDSAALIAFIDSAYINARVEALDSAEVINIVTPEINARVQTLDIGQVVGAPGQAGEYLTSTGNGNGDWRNFDSDVGDYLGRVDRNLLPDSAFVRDIGSIDKPWNSIYIAGETVRFVNRGRLGVFTPPGQSKKVLQFVSDDAVADSPGPISLLGNTTADLPEDSAVNFYFTEARARSSLTVQGDLNYDSVTGILSYTTPEGVDSGGITNLIDSAYINLRVDPAVDSAEVIKIVIPEINSRVQTIDIAQVVGDPGAPGQLLSSLGNGNAQWIDQSSAVDSATVQAIIDSAYINARVSGVDSDAIIALIDSAYIQSRQVDLFRDSAFITGLIDSSFVQARQIRYLDSAATNNLITSAVNVLDISDIVGATGQPGQILQSLGNGNAQWVNEFDSGEVISLIDSAFIQSRQLTYLDSSLIIGLIDSAYINFRTDANIDSAQVLNIVDSAYVAARAGTGTDSAQVNNLINAAIGVLDISDIVGSTGQPGEILQSLGNGNAQWVNEFDSAEVLALIDSAYINARAAGGGIDSSLVIQLIDSAYVQARIDSDYISTIVDSAYVNFRVDPQTLPNVLDSQEIISLIDSAYVQARVDSAYISVIVDSAYVNARVDAASAGGLDSAATNNLINAAIGVLDVSDIVGATGTPGQILQSLGNGNAQWVNEFDSNEVIGLIDSAYINLRTDATIDSAKIFNIIDSAYINAKVDDLWLDSAEAIALIDSAYISSRVDVVLSGGLDSALANNLINSAIGVLDVSDIVGSTGTPGQILQSLGNGNAQWVNEFDSAEVLGLIDSAYVAARAPSAADFLDSAEVIALIDSAYIQLRQIDYLDSSLTQKLIDSAYINFRVDDVWLDSAEATALIDSAYVQLRQIDYLDSSLTLNLIDSAYINARVNVTAAGGLDSSLSLSLINSRIQTLDIGQIVGDPGQAGQVLLSAGNGNATWNDAFDSDAAKTAIDSAYLSVIVDSAYINLRTDATIDSAKIFNIIDSAYINFRVDDLWLDSADAIGLIDSAYINFRVDDIWLDSAEATALIDSAYISSRINNDLFIDSSEALPLINSRIQTLDIGQVVGSPGAVGQILQSTGNGNAQWIEAFDSAETIQLVDSAYVQARQVAPNYILFGLDSAVQNETDTEMRTMGSAATGWRMPVGGTVTNVTMQLEVTTNSASQTLTAELVKNGVKTGKTVAVDVSSTGFAGTDSAISETYVAGDRLTLYITTSDATMVTNEHNAIVRVLENL